MICTRLSSGTVAPSSLTTCCDLVSSLNALVDVTRTELRSGRRGCAYSNHGRGACRPGRAWGVVAAR